jgi:hypothetical protein
MSNGERAVSSEGARVVLRTGSTAWRVAVAVVLLCLGCGTTPRRDVHSQLIEFPAAAAADPAVLSKAMPGLARTVLAAYREDDRRKYLDTLFRLQMVAGQFADASTALSELRAMPASTVSPQPGATLVVYEMLATARIQQNRDGSTFDDAFRRAFRETFAKLDDPTSALVLRALVLANQTALRADLHDRLKQQSGKTTISLADARNLIRAYHAEEAFRSLTPLAPALVAEDDGRRYVIDKDVPVRTPDGATVCAIVARPRAAPGRLPALLEFTIYVDADQNLNGARRAASHGYASIVGFARGKGCSPDKPVAYVHDGSDAAALIDWISRQPWSDGRVGMYGGSYSGFTQWAAAKHMPKGADGRRAGGPRHRRADGRQCLLELHLSVALLRHERQGARQRDLQRHGALGSAESQLVRERPGLPRDGQDRRNAQSDLRRVDRPPGLRCLLAGHDSL